MIQGELGHYAKVVTVAKVGGQYTTVKAGVDAATALTPSSTNPILVLIWPGIYTETQQIDVVQFTTIAGFGPDVSIIKNATVANTFSLPGGDAPGEDWVIEFRGVGIYGTHAGDGQGIKCAITTDTHRKELHLTNCYIYGLFDGVHTIQSGGHFNNFWLTANNCTFESDADGLAFYAGSVVGGTATEHFFNNCTIRVLSDHDTGFSGAVNGNVKNSFVLNNCEIDVSCGDADATEARGAYNTLGSVRIYGGSIKITQANGSGAAYAVSVFTGSQTVIGCDISVTSTSNSGNAAGGYSASTSTQKHIGNKINISADSGDAYGIYSGGTSSVITGCDIVTASDSGSAYDLRGGTIKTIGCNYDTTKTVGTITVPDAVIPSGTAPTPATEGVLFLDTDAGANGTLVCYSNGAWRTVQAF